MPVPAPTPPVPNPVSRRALALCGAVIAAAALAAYWGSFSGPFLYDDVDSVLRNVSIRSFAAAFRPPGGLTVSGRPVLNLSFALSYAISGSAPWSYHALNLAIHVGAALLLFGIVRRTIALARPQVTSEGSLWLAFGAALLWALHPLQTESVAYVVQRAESLMGFFYLATLYGFIRFAAGDGSSRWASVSVAACLLGMGTKEVMATAPLIVLLYDRTFLAKSFAEAWRRRRTLYLAYAACWIPLAFLVAGTSGRGGSAGFGSGVPWWAYLYAVRGDRPLPAPVGLA
jgi:hypothetical protein